MYALELDGKLRRVSKEVDKDWELSSIARCVFQGLDEKQRFALLFENVKGYGAPVVTGAFGASRDIYAFALGTTPDRIYEKWADSLANPIPPVEVRNGPAKEIICKGGEASLFDLPVPIWTPGRDGGPYITAPCVITRDPDTGIQNVGTFRMMVQAKDQTGILISPHQHIGFHFAKYQSRGQPMPVAIAIGVDPAIGLASVAKIPYGVDELCVSGAIRGEPVEVIKAETVDLMVPATAEYIVEGFVPIDERASEGPFGEYTGHMGTRGDRTIVKVTCITHRQNPIYQAYTSQIPPSESSCLRGQAFASAIWRQMVRELKEPGVLDVHISESSGSQAHVLIQMKPHYPGHAKKVAMLAASLDPIYGKIVTVVDPDIDIRDLFSIDWAVAYRVDPARDIVIVPNTAPLNLDPSTSDQTKDTAGRVLEAQAMGSKLLIDATVKSTYPEISLAPADYIDRVMEEWDDLGLPPLELPNRVHLLLKHHPPGDTFRPFR